MSVNASLLRPFSPETEADSATLAGRLRSELSEADAVDFLYRTIAVLAQRPRWAPAAQELLWKGRAVKYIRCDGAHQTAVLEAFQKAGWPHYIKDPLPPGAGRKAKSRRRNTVKSLNKGLKAETIRFHSEGGDGIRWEEVV